MPYVSESALKIGIEVIVASFDSISEVNMVSFSSYVHNASLRHISFEAAK